MKLSELQAGMIFRDYNRKDFRNDFIVRKVDVYGMHYSYLDTPEYIKRCGFNKTLHYQINDEFYLDPRWNSKLYKLLNQF